MKIILLLIKEIQILNCPLFSTASVSFITRPQRMIMWLEMEMFIQRNAKIIYEKRVLLDAMRVCATKENISGTFRYFL